MSDEFDVVMAGEVFADLIFTGLPRIPELGEELYATDFAMVPGGIFITAATLSRLGMRVGLYCHIGNDPLSRFVLAEMEKENLDLSLVRRVDHPMWRVSVAMSLPGPCSAPGCAPPPGSLR